MTISRSLQLLAGVACLAVLAAPVAADTKKKVKLSGENEVPTVITDGSGEFRARIAHDELSISYELSYEDIEGTVTQAHIHIGAAGTAGGIVLWLCGNPNPPAINPPAGTPLCPPSPGFVSGTLDAGDVTPVPAQGIAANDLADVIRAIRKGLAYVNVHSSVMPPGAVRGQFHGGDHHHHHDD